jgi:serine-type D-Ala-D-Ala carboxypeptidase (penicillin-binding protein 5/6)
VVPGAAAPARPDLRRALLGVLVCAALALPAVGGPPAAVAQEAGEDAAAEPEAPLDPAGLLDPPPAAPPAVTARGAVLWDPADGRILHGVEAEASRPMASTTKIMTVLLALEAGTLDDVVTVSARAAALGEASLGLRTGQQLPMRSLVAGLLVRSGNDAALAVAEHVAGDEAAFVARMNARAAELGLTATRFVNASGLTNDTAHHASPLDLARLADVAMADPTFAEFAGGAVVTVPGLPTMVNRNELLGVYPGATGVKTGFTRLAGLSLVASADRDGRTLYAVVLGSDDSFTDTAALLDYGFTAFRRAEPVTAGAPVTTYRWSDAAVELVADGDLGATVAVDAAVTWRAALVPDLDRPAAAGAPAGVAQLLVGGEVREEVPLRTAGPVGATAEDLPAGARAGAALQDALRALVRSAPVDRAA